MKENHREEEKYHKLCWRLWFAISFQAIFLDKEKIPPGRAMMYNWRRFASHKAMNPPRPLQTQISPWHEVMVTTHCDQRMPPALPQ